jgi:glycosyltransferase involved in cell wall biosynthesis
MKLLFVVQRYGHDVPGGAEVFCREFATRLAARGHDVTVLTSCAVNYVDWANHYPEGSTVIDGVTVHRLAVDKPRDDPTFNALNARTIAGHFPIPLYMQQEWMRMQGPALGGLRSWLETNVGGFDVAVFFTYLYFTSWAGLPISSSFVPTVLHPTAHDEPPLYLPLFSSMFKLPSAFGFLTEEEAALVQRRFRPRRPSVVLGVGVELDPPADAARFREAYGLGDDPYLAYVGRLDPHKGTDELFEFFSAYKARNPGPLRLALVGEPARPMPEHPDIIQTGFVSEQTKHDALAGCLALVHPSLFESFSIVLIEAWAHGRPALVQGRCAVLAGQARRSGGAFPYTGFAEFEAAVDMLVEDSHLRERLGAAGREYARTHYSWNEILLRYEVFLDRVASKTKVELLTP